MGPQPMWRLYKNISTDSIALGIVSRSFTLALLRFGYTCAQNRSSSYTQLLLWHAAAIACPSSSPQHPFCKGLSSSLIAIVQAFNSSTHARSTHNLQASTAIQWRIGNSIIPRTPLNQWYLPTCLNFVHILSCLHVNNLNAISLVTATSEVRAIAAEAQCLDRALGAIEGLFADEVGCIPECDKCIGTTCREPSTRR